MTKEERLEWLKTLPTKDKRRRTMTRSFLAFLEAVLPNTKLKSASIVTAPDGTKMLDMKTRIK
jgi:hypothetical protein